jgi:hypothetical protein
MSRAESGKREGRRETFERDIERLENCITRGVKRERNARQLPTRVHPHPLVVAVYGMKPLESRVLAHLPCFLQPITYRKYKCVLLVVITKHGKKTRRDRSCHKTTTKQPPFPSPSTLSINLPMQRKLGCFDHARQIRVLGLELFVCACACACMLCIYLSLQAGTKREQCTCNVYLRPRPSLLCYLSNLAPTNLFNRRLPFLGLAKGAAALVQLG